MSDDYESFGGNSEMNTAMRWGAAALVAGVLLTSGQYTGQASVVEASNIKDAVKQPTVILKWKGTTLTQKGVIYNGNTLIPVTVLRDVMGLPLHYNAGTRTYSVGSGYRQLNMDISQYGANTNINNFYVNEYEVKNIEGRLYVPFRLISDYLGYQGVWNSSLKSLNITPRVEEDTSITTKKQDANTNDASIIARYPLISRLKDPKVEKSINSTLEKLTNEFVEASNKQIATRDNAVERTYQFLQNYIVSYHENGLLSLVIDQYSYTGGAHGGTVRIGLTFSLEDGKVRSLDELLVGKSPDYKVKLNKVILEGFQKNDFYFGEFKGLTNDVNYYLKPDGVAVFFQQYEYTAYASGIPTFVIPYHTLLSEGMKMFK
ncbi:PdaC/SigV domain-containing protein [Paenibacillus sp. CMAA1364]